MGEVLSTFIEVNLSMFIENDRRTWNFHQLLKEVKDLQWSDYKTVEQAVTDFEQKIKFIKDNRDKRLAHTSKTNQPTVLHTMVGGYEEFIIKAMEILDMFTDKPIPYYLNDANSKEVDLRAFIVQGQKRNDSLLTPNTRPT